MGSAVVRVPFASLARIASASVRSGMAHVSLGHSGAPILRRLVRRKICSEEHIFMVDDFEVRTLDGPGREPLSVLRDADGAALPWVRGRSRPLREQIAVLRDVPRPAVPGMSRPRRRAWEGL